MSLRDVIAQRIASDGPLPFAEYMELVLYHPELGYYARAAQRSGRAGDFFTSVDVGSLFGEFLAVQIAEMWRLLKARTGDASHVDLVEAAAGNGRLSRDLLDATATHHADLYDATRLTLVERSPAARAGQVAALQPHLAKLERSMESLPTHVNGVIFANELLDALPVHPVVMTESGLREVYVDAEGPGGERLVERLGAPRPEVLGHVERFGIDLELGWRAEVSPAVVRWIELAGSSLDRGFLIVIDYGHDARELYSATHATGTLATYRQHVVQNTGTPHSSTPPWLEVPGEADVTAHVDLTAVRMSAEAAGMQTLAVVDQTYFLLGLGADRLDEPDDPVAALRRRLALKTLLVPGGLGSTHKVMIFGKNVGHPELRATSFSHRAT